MPLDRDRLLKPVKKLRKLLKKIGSDPTPDEVHELRTKARRFEANYEALRLKARGNGKSILKDLGRCRKRAGRVRDMDVLTGYASTLHPKGEEECSVQLLEHLGARRRKRARQLYSEIKRLRPSLRRELDRAADRLAKLIRRDRVGPAENGAAPDLAATTARFAAQLAAPGRLDRKTLHPYRLKIKDLLDVLQLESGASRLRVVGDLGKAKDAIGEWHDWEELSSIARKSLDHGKGCRLLAELRRIAENKYTHALALARSLRSVGNGLPLH